ncbi:MAG: thymidylate kinase [Candidatus Pacearchaeota archaeon]|nr:MAG: thymidylate kinase [Candidatus Pacearchaeota archaeon]
MFIVLEGIDGCGKSTQIINLADFFFHQDKYNHIVVTREPYRRREIREILKTNEMPNEKKDQLVYLFVEDRKEHFKEVIIPSLNRGHIVLCDRYKYSTICYQSAQGFSLERLLDMHRFMPVPDLVFVFDVNVETALKRVSYDYSRKKESKFEQKNFLEVVRRNYLSLNELFPDENIILIDGNESERVVFEKIKKAIQKI